MSTASHYQTLAAAEEQHLAALSATTATTMTSSSSTTKTAKVKTTKKISKKSSQSSIEITDSSQTMGSIMANGVKDLQKQQQLQQQQESHFAEESTISQESSTTMVVSNGSVQQSKKIVKKKLTAATSVSLEQGEILQQQQQQLQQQQQKTTAIAETDEKGTTTTAATETISTSTATETATEKVAKATTNGKKKTKKSKKSEAEKENISVKSSFSKFDALQKKNLIHVRSSDAGKAQEKFSDPQAADKDRNCRLCSKPVYKMEEIKAEKSIYHKNCFRCQECDKQLKVDNYQSHEGVLYCMVHFKLLFAPKFVEDSAPEKPRKPELIIRENQPLELPPDVVRASDKPDLGLEELQQLNVRSKFQVFENGSSQTEQQTVERSPSQAGVKRSSSILSKMAKLQARGFTTGLSVEATEEDEDDSCASSVSGSDSGSDGDDDGDRDLVRSKKRTQRERPVGLGHAMNDIKTKFEKGHVMSKEERREERKQEIQNIRSRLFMGKQARIKEMYQQAVADSEQAITSVGKKPEIDIGDKARSLKERFEKGEMFRDGGRGAGDEEVDGDASRSGGVQVDEADVFESAITKKSRSIFMELDANAAAGKNQGLPPSRPQGIQRIRSSGSNRFSESEQEGSSTFQQQQENVVKHDEKPEDIKIETSEISSKFKFFETYRPTECQKKAFRITPPREGVVKLPDSADGDDDNGGERRTVDADAEIIEKTHTASTMLNKFREMEQRKQNADSGPRPLKCFTPPPDGGRRLYQDQESGSEEYEEEDDDEDEEEDEECEEEDDEQQFRQSKLHLEDEALKEAQAAARAKQLRAKFERWEANEIQREMNEGRVNIYSDQVSDDSTIESAKKIRERFENMKNLERTSPNRPRYQVNRFV